MRMRKIGVDHNSKQLPFKVVRIDGDPIKGHVAIRVVCGALCG